MTITLYSGTPGSGKSLHAARDILGLIRRDKPIITNFEIALDKATRHPERVKNYHYLPNEKITPDVLMQIAREYWGDRTPVEGGITVFLDECQLMFNSRDYQSKNRKSWLSFFSQHRKYGFNIILIAQFDRMIDRQIRCLIEWEFKHRRFGNFGKIGKVFTILTFGETFVVLKYYYPCAEKVGNGFFRAHKRVYGIYDTYSTFTPLTAPDGLKDGTDARVCVNECKGQGSLHEGRNAAT